MVSVIIPNYNHAHFLNERIESVLAQTYQDLEIIILDDVSTDNSRQIIEQYRHNAKVSQIIYNDTNSGSTFKQWEKGLQLAKGAIIWIAESDDYCENNLLEILVSGMAQSTSCVLAYAQSYCIDAANNINWLTRCKKLEEHVNGIKFIKTHLLKGTSIVNASMAIFKKEAYLKIAKDYTTFRFSGDWLFWIEIARHGDVFISGRYLNFFRKHDKDVSGKAYATGFNFIENLKILRHLKSYSLLGEKLYQQLIYLKYSQFKLNKKLYSKEAVAQIEQDFVLMFPTKWQAKKYFMEMSVKENLKSLGGKSKI